MDLSEVLIQMERYLQLIATTEQFPVPKQHLFISIPDVQHEVD